MSSVSSIQLLVIQPTPFCNLDCTYCYLPDRNNKKRMTSDTLEAIGKCVVASPLFTEETTVVWHAGEPCVLSPDWYRDAIASIEYSADRRIGRQSIQTNATLLNDGWISFIKEQDIALGVSLDGPEWINDARRVTRKGAGTYQQTMRGIAKLRAENIPFHVIAVVTAEALAHPVEFAQALVDTGAYSIGLNIEEIDGDNSQSSLFQANSEPSFESFLARFLDTVEAHSNPPHIREYDRFIGALKQGTNITRHMENSPGAIVSVSRTGDLATFSPELLGIKSDRYNDFVFGNVHNLSDVASMFLNRSYLRTMTDVQSGISKCRKTCRYFGICGGGSPSNKLGETGRFDSTETAFCRLSVQAVFDALLQRAGVEV